MVIWRDVEPDERPGRTGRRVRRTLESSGPSSRARPGPESRRVGRTSPWNSRVRQVPEPGGTLSPAVHRDGEETLIRPAVPVLWDRCLISRERGILLVGAATASSGAPKTSGRLMRPQERDSGGSQYMCPIDRDPRPETQWDAHRPKGSPRPREAKFQKAQLDSELRQGELKEVKRPIGNKLTSLRPDSVRKHDRPTDLSVSAQQVLDRDKNLRSYDLSVSVTADGVARVTGIVDSLAEKRLVSDILAQVEGINKVENGIAISTDGRITDDDVLMEVSEEIALDSRVKSIPDIRVERGHVTLVGMVDSDEERQAMIESASRARGVTEITDNLKVDDGEIDWDDLDAVFHSQVRNDGERQV